MAWDRSYRVSVEINLADIDLLDLIERVRQEASPEDVFLDSVLAQWAKDHGWVRDVAKE
jgi:hypothetical protein